MLCKSDLFDIPCPSDRPKLRTGSESLEVRLFSEAEIPWDEIAFRVIEETLIQFLKDRAKGLFPFHIGNIYKKATGQPPRREDTKN